jgi:acetolactate synthase-1/2/3 large subunit
MANPGRPVVAIVGDACFQMNGMELLTAVEYQVPVLWIVENNQMHGITWHGSQLLSGGRAMEAVKYKRPIEVAAIARAMGLRVWTVDKPGQMGAIVREALSSQEPGLIEVRVDGRIAPYLSDRAETIAGFKR